MDFTTSLFNVAMLIAFAVPGFLLSKFRLLPEKSNVTLTNILIYVSMPFLAFSSFAKKQYDESLLGNIGLMLVFGAFLCFVAYFVSYLCFCKTKKKLERGALVASSYMSNFGFMGIPVIMALFPSRPEMLIYASIFLLCGNVFSWTLTVYLVTGDKRNVSIKNAVLNPPVIASVLALLLFVLKVDYPETVKNAFNYLGDTSVPLSMMLIGIRLAECDFIKLLKNTKVYFASIVKLVLVPLVVFGFLMLFKVTFGIEKYLAVTLFIIMAMPTLNATLLAAEKFGGEIHLITECILFSNIACVITIPLLTLLVEFL